MREGAASSTGTTSRRPFCKADPNKLVPSAGSRHSKSRPSSSKLFEITSMNPTEIADALLIQNHVTRVEVQSDQLVIELTDAIGVGSKRKQKSRQLIEVPWRKTLSTRRREILVPESEAPQNIRPIRSENRALLVASIARGRRWLDELITDPAANTESIAEREGCSVRRVNMTISLAFLAPDLVKAAIDGRLPHGMGVVRLSDMPAEWSRQHLMLGFNT